MADPVSGEMPPRREPPAFNVPGPVLLLLLAMVAVHVAV